MIHKACQNTEYYDLCLSSLRTDPNSTRADAKGLAQIVIGVVAANATASSLSLSSMVVGMANDPGSAKLPKECADNYSLASDALQAAAQDFIMELYDHTYGHVTAAQDYLNACHNSFGEEHRVDLSKELACREDGLERLYDVILGIIDFLGD